MVDYKLSKTELIYILQGYSPTIDLADDDDLKKCGRMDRPAFSYEDLRWYWDEDKMEGKSIETLMRILKLVKYQTNKIVSEVEFEKQKIPPKYVTLKHSALRLTNSNRYYRDGGCWGVDYEWVGGKLLSVSHMEHLNGHEMIKITKAQYAKDNKGYLPKKY